MNHIEWMATPSQLQQADASGEGQPLPVMNPDGSITIPAEPAAPKAPPASSGGRTFTEEDIERAREQEKTKVYGRLEKAERDAAAARAELERLAKERADAEAAAAEAARLAREAEMSAHDLILQKEKEWADQLAAVRAENEQTRAMLEMERRFASLEQYRQARMAEEADNILPELRDLVSGDSEDAIENAIAILKDRTAAIVSSVQQQFQQQQPPAQPTVGRGTGITAPPVGPMESQPEFQTLTAEQIRNMDMDTYAKMRNRVLPPGALKPQGLFDRGGSGRNY